MASDDHPPTAILIHLGGISDGSLEAHGSPHGEVDRQGRSEQGKGQHLVLGRVLFLGQSVVDVRQRQVEEDDEIGLEGLLDKSPVKLEAESAK